MASVSRDKPTEVGECGLKHDSVIHCDEMISLPKSGLAHFVGRLTDSQLADLNRSLRIALEIEE